PSSPMLGLRFCCIELESPIATALQTPGLWDVRPPQSETDGGRDPHVGCDTGAPLLGEPANLSQREARATYGQGGRNVKRDRPAACSGRGGPSPCPLGSTPSLTSRSRTRASPGSASPWNGWGSARSSASGPPIERRTSGRRFWSSSGGRWGSTRRTAF